MEALLISYSLPKNLLHVVSADVSSALRALSVSHLDLGFDALAAEDVSAFQDYVFLPGFADAALEHVDVGLQYHIWLFIFGVFTAN